MADNFEVASGSGGPDIAAASITFSGDTVYAVGGFGIILSGSADSYVGNPIVGGAGDVAAGVQRVTLANNDPAVAALQTIDNAISGAGFNITQFAGVGISMGTGARDAGTQRVTIATNDSLAVTNAGTFAVQAVCTNAGTFATQAVCTNAGTFAVQATLAAETTKVIGTVNIAAAQTVATVTTVGAVTAITNALPAGDNNIGNVDIVSGTITTVSTVTNVSQLGGQAIAMGTGVRTAGTLRVTVATDDTVPVSIASVPSHAVTNAGTFAVQAVCTNAGTFATQAVCTNAGTFAVQATLGAETTKVIGTINIAAAQTLATVTTVGTVTTCSTVTNLSQLGGQAVSMGTGARDAGTQRVTIATNDVVPVSGTVAVTGMTACNTGAVVLAAGTAEIGKLAAGTAAIGKLAANSGVDIGDVDVTSIAAGTNTIGGIISQHSSSIVYDGTTACTVKRFMVVVDASGEVVIAAPSGTKKIRVLSMSVFALSATASTFYLETGTTNTDCFGTSAGPITLDMDGVGGPAGVVLPWNPGGWFQTADNDEAVEVVMSSTEKMLFCGNYIEVA